MLETGEDDAVDLARRNQRQAMNSALSEGEIVFDVESGLLLKAVLAGQGAGLLPAAMVALDVAEGRLLKLADQVLLDNFAYYLVYPEASRERAKVVAFRTWILDAAARDEALRFTPSEVLPSDRETGT